LTAPPAHTITAEEIRCSPAWLPLEPAAARAMRLVRLDETAYQAASFLDQRLLGLGYEHGVCGVDVLEAAAAGLAPRPHYVFHSGHVGSTLISRLIGAQPGLFALREPALLRELAWNGPGAAALGLDAALALLARTWRPSERAVVKVTSFVSELAEPILAADGRSAAIFMFVGPLSYLRGILAGPNSRAETRQLAPSRLQRLARRLRAGEWGAELHSEGEAIAMSWLCEMTALCQAAATYRQQVFWVNFDAFLREPRAGLEAIFRFLGVEAPANDIRALVAGPLMHQYSKAPEYAYDAELRRRVLLSADAEHGAEIRRGIDWLRKVAMRHRLIEAVLDMCAHPAP
jgi:hypothetical protein